MTLLIRAELLKLRTVRLTYGLILTVAALTALFAVIESSIAGKVSGTYAVASLATVAGQTTVTTLTSWSMILAAVLGVLVASGEFRHSSATLTTSPPRIATASCSPKCPRQPSSERSSAW